MNTYRSGWVFLLASNRGKRDRNDDFVDVTNIGGTTGKACLVTCDGVSARPNSGTCAAVVGAAALQEVQRSFSNEEGGGVLQHARVSGVRRRISSLRLRLAQLPVNDVPLGAATTLALCVASGRSVIAYWAGDSRAYVMANDDKYILTQLTQDHINNDDRLTSTYGADGAVRGELGMTYRYLKRSPVAICVTTDGVHNACEAWELESFVRYCVRNRLDSSNTFAQLLNDFIEENIVDNFSMALAWRHGRGG